MNRDRLGLGVVGIAAGLVFVVLASACATGSSKSTASSAKITVVAAEDFWGSIAKQLGGDRVDVQSLVANPDADPHDYEPAPGDGRAVASARVVVTNGIGYDPWMDKLVAANPAAGRAVLNVGNLVGLKEGDNPHQWYSPTTVRKVIDAVTEQYKRVDSADATYFDQQRTAFLGSALADYSTAIASIKAKYAGTAVGASESIFVPLAADLGLKMMTPDTFLTAISEGSDPGAADKAVVDQQIVSKTIKVFVFNSQNATPDVQRLVDLARATGIPVATVTETLTPAGATFQEWQTRQLRALEAALASATGP